MLRIILATWTGEGIEVFGRIDVIDARLRFKEASWTRHPQATASAAARPKLSYLEEEIKNLDSCIKGANCAGEVGGRKVIWEWGDLAGSPEPITREVQDGF